MFSQKSASSGNVATACRVSSASRLHFEPPAGAIEEVECWEKSWEAVVQAENAKRAIERKLSRAGETFTHSAHLYGAEYKKARSRLVEALKNEEFARLDMYMAKISIEAEVQEIERDACA